MYVDHRLEERVGQHRRLEVVAPGRERWPVSSAIHGHPVAAVAAQHVELGLDAHVHPVAERGRRVQLVLQQAPEVVGVRLVVQPEVGRGHRVPAVPGQHGQRVKVGDGDALVLVRPEIPHALERADRVELRPGRHVGEVTDRDALGLRYPVHVHVRAEEVAHAIAGQFIAQCGQLSGVHVFPSVHRKMGSGSTSSSSSVTNVNSRMTKMVRLSSHQTQMLSDFERRASAREVREAGGTSRRGRAAARRGRGARAASTTSTAGSSRCCR